MDMNILKHFAFVYAVEYGSFTKAAEILHYTQSGISRMIMDLEKEWNITLLERSKKGVKLTSDGMKLFPYAKRLCSEYQRLQMQLENINGIQTGIIRIGTISSVAAHWLPNIIKRFKQDYPNIEYELLLGDYTEIERWIKEGRVDFGFLREGKNYYSIPLKKDKLMAVLPKGHMLCKYDKIPLDRLCAEDFILLERGARAEISAMLDKCNIKPNVCFTTWDDYAVMSMVEKGLGVSILPELILERIPYEIEIKELDSNEAYRNIVFAVRDENTTPIAVKKFMEYLKYRE